MLQAFLDGEVGVDQAEQVAAHLESCHRCGSEPTLIRAVIAAIRTRRPDLDLAAYTRLVATVDGLACEIDTPRGSET